MPVCHDSVVFLHQAVQISRHEKLDVKENLLLYSFDRVAHLSTLNEFEKLLVRCCSSVDWLAVL